MYVEILAWTSDNSLVIINLLRVSQFETLHVKSNIAILIEDSSRVFDQMTSTSTEPQCHKDHTMYECSMQRDENKCTGICTCIKYILSKNVYYPYFLFSNISIRKTREPDKQSGKPRSYIKKVLKIYFTYYYKNKDINARYLSRCYKNSRYMQSFVAQTTKRISAS